MIAVDICSMIAFFNGDVGRDVDLVADALSNQNLYMPPVVLSELLSDSAMPAAIKEVLLEIPLIPLKKEYWQRAGELRGALLARKLKARLADTMIAAACIDVNVPLITRDVDYRHFVKYGGLRLA